MTIKSRVENIVTTFARDARSGMYTPEQITNLCNIQVYALEILMRKYMHHAVLYAQTIELLQQTRDKVNVN